MPSQLALIGSLFAILMGVYWYLQLGTGFFSRHYFPQIAFLMGNGILGGWFVLAVFTQARSATIAEAILGGLIGFLSVVLLALGLIKLFFLPGDRPRRLGSLERSQTMFASPTKRFSLETEDGVKIQVVHLVKDPQRQKVVIVCHGGGRNKDIYANVITCELLFEDYDVITFDFRGHQESGGKWTGDGSTKYDLKAVIDYARKQGYEKIGVIGRSFGAWTAVMEVAEYKNADTVVAAAPPPTDLREVKVTKLLFSLGYRFWMLPARILATVIRGVRIRKYDRYPSLMTFVDQVSPIPLLIVCNEYDRAIGMPVERFKQLYDRAKEPKKFVVLKGKGHIYDWPNTFHYLTLIREWLAETMGNERAIT